MNLTNLHKSDPLSGARFHMNYIHKLANGLFQYLEYEYRRPAEDTAGLLRTDLCMWKIYIFFFHPARAAHTNEKNIYIYILAR